MKLKTDSKKDNNLGSLRQQLSWMIGLWLGGVVALYLFVKLAKTVMSVVGLGA